MKRSPVINQSSSSWENKVKSGREAFRNQDWNEAFSRLCAADKEKPLDSDDLRDLGKAAYLLGKEAESTAALTRAHRSYVNKGDIEHSIQSAFWLGFILLMNGEPAQAGGWLSRAERLCEGREDCVEKGLLFLPVGFRSLSEGDYQKAHAAFANAAAIGIRFGDKDLLTIALNGQGRALIGQGEIARGVALLDEAMIAVTAGEVSPMVVGGVYCSVIDACGKIFDLRRAQEWTSALDRWCLSQGDYVSYRGHCMLRRAEILELHGAWPEAANEAQLALDRLSRPAIKRSAGPAFYRLGELHRLRGEFDQAEDFYRRASHAGTNPQPGLALLRLNQGQIDVACAAIRRMAEEAKELNFRALVLDACVEILLAAKDYPAARSAAKELEQIADHLHAPLLNAISLRATGTVLLGEEDVAGALAMLRRSWNLWCELEAPYEAARVQFLIALAYRKLGDHDTADLQLEAARSTFIQLGAAPDLDRIKSFEDTAKGTSDSLLTARETQVLKLVASGMTNKEIASSLDISGKTVARHLSNIFMKLDLSTRAAATAYAYQHHLL